MSETQNVYSGSVTLNNHSFLLKIYLVNLSNGFDIDMHVELNGIIISKLPLSKLLISLDKEPIQPLIKSSSAARLTHQQRKERRKHMVMDYKQGLTVPQISVKYDVSLATVYKAIKEFECQIIRKPRVSRKNDDIIADIMDLSLKFSDIAKKHKVSRQRVHQIKSQMLAAGLNIPQRIKNKSRLCDVCGCSHNLKTRQCSRKCKMTKRLNKAQSKESKWSRLIYKTYVCHGCGNNFSRSNYIDSITRSRVNTGHRYCSQECYRRRNRYV